MEHAYIAQRSTQLYSHSFKSAKMTKGLPWWLSGKITHWQCRRHKRHRFNPWVRKAPEGGHGNLLQYFCLENTMERGAWWATVHRTAESDMTEATEHVCRMTTINLKKKKKDRQFKILKGCQAPGILMHSGRVYIKCSNPTMDNCHSSL